MDNLVNSDFVRVVTDAGVYAAYRAYSEVTGVPMRELVGEALKDFAECSISARMESIQEQHSDSKVVSIDSGY